MELTVKCEPITQLTAKLREKGINILYVSRDASSDYYTLVFATDLTEEQKTVVKQTIEEVTVAERLKGVEPYDADNIRSLTKEEVVNYIETKVTDFASAKAFLKKLAVFTLYLYKRLMEVETT